MTSSTTRIEIFSDRIKLTFTDYQSLHRELRRQGLFQHFGEQTEALTEEQKTVLQSLYATVDYEMNSIRIASAKQYASEAQKYVPTAANLAYYETDISEREATQAEKQPYEDSFMDCPEPVYEFSIPPLEKFQNPLEHTEFTTAIQNPTDLETQAQTLQHKIETAKRLKIKTSSTGARTNLDPEWNPSLDSTKTKATKESAKQKYFTARQIWRELFHLDYEEWFASRLYLLGNSKRKLHSRNIVALELLEEGENESFCQYCGRIDTTDTFLHIPNKLDREKRVCRRCAENYSEFEDEQIPN